MFSLGDILHIDAPIVDHKKYHISLGNNEYEVVLCLFINSDDRFEGSVSFDDTRFPMLPRSKTGRSAVSLSMLPRYNERQLALFKARKLGELSKDVAVEIATACETAKTLTREEKRFVIERLTTYAAS